MASKKEILKFILGLKLKQLRLDKGLSLKTLSNLAGLSSSYLNEIEKSKKYPKIDKLMTLSQVLGVPFDDLVSIKLDKNLDPLEKYLKSDFFKELPLELFGISHKDLYDLMAESPEKFASFITTVIEMARSYDLKFEQLLFAALRSYQEMHKNYFPEIEDLAQQTRKKYYLAHNSGMPSLNSFIMILQKDFSYKIDENKLNLHPELNSLRTLFKSGPPHTLFINKNLQESQKIFILAKEIGYQILKLKKRALTSPEIKLESFDMALNHFKSSYFSGALLIDQHLLVKDLKVFFKEKTFSKEKFLQLLNHYGTGPEIFLQRLTQILPQFFHLNQLFFLRFNNDYQQDHYYLTKELHLSQLHNPHGIGLNEHYCRRWITVSLLKELAEDLKKGDYQRPILGIQRSKMFENNMEYLCLSMARPLTLSPHTTSCTTIGILIDGHFKKTVKFWDDPSIPLKEVSQTCERCGILDCEVRAAPPSLFEKEKVRVNREKAVQQLLTS